MPATFARLYLFSLHRLWFLPPWYLALPPAQEVPGWVGNLAVLGTLEGESLQPSNFTNHAENTLRHARIVRVNLFVGVPVCWFPFEPRIIEVDSWISLKCSVGSFLKRYFVWWVARIPKAYAQFVRHISLAGCATKAGLGNLA